MRPYHQGIVLHTLYFPAEVREISEYGKTENMTLQKPEMDLAEQFIRQLTAKFEPEQYKDEYQQRVLDLIETKRAGQIVAGQPPKPKLAPVIDLMEALKKSIAERGAPAAAPTLVEADKKKAPKISPSSRRQASSPPQDGLVFLPSALPARQVVSVCGNDRIVIPGRGLDLRVLGG